MRLLPISQKKGEKLRDFIHHFNTGRLNIGDYSDDVAMAALNNDLRDRHLMKFRNLYHLEDFDIIMDHVKDHMHANEVHYSFVDEHLNHIPSRKAHEKWIGPQVP